MAACVPTVWMMLVDHMDRNGLRLPALRAALVAGTKPPRSLIEALETAPRRRGGQCWGMTEALGVTKCSLPPGLADAPYEQRVEQKLRQGRVAFGTRLRIVDDAGKRAAARRRGVRPSAGHGAVDRRRLPQAGGADPTTAGCRPATWRSSSRRHGRDRRPLQGRHQVGRRVDLRAPPSRMPRWAIPRWRRPR